MGATITTIDQLPKRKRQTKKMKELREKLLKGPTMTAEQKKFYEKLYPWLKKYKDD